MQIVHGMHLCELTNHTVTALRHAYSATYNKYFKMHPIWVSLRKHAYSNILKTLQPKKGNFLDKKNSDIFHISAQNIDCVYSLERLAYAVLTSLCF